MTTHLSYPPTEDTGMQSKFTPSEDDVFTVRRHLLRFVPAELALAITNLAEYWPKVASTRDAFTGPTSVHTTGSNEWCYALSPPIPSYSGLRVKPMKARFVLSCEAECTYGSISSMSTLFHAAVIKSRDVSQNILCERIEDEPERQIHSWNISNPQRWLIEDISYEWPGGTRKEFIWDDNGLASSLSSSDEPLINALRSGDRVAVMVNGLVPGWMNCIYTVTTEIYYSI